MSKVLDKSWPIISLLLLLALLASLFFWPALARPLSGIVLFAGIGMAVFFTVRRHRQAHRRGKLTRAQFIRNTALDLFGLALTMTVALWLGGLAGQYAAQRTGTGLPAVIASLLAALGVGFAAAWLVQKIWEMATRLWAAGAG